MGLAGSCWLSSGHAGAVGQGEGEGVSAWPCFGDSLDTGSGVGKVL